MAKVLGKKFKSHCNLPILLDIQEAFKYFVGSTPVLCRSSNLSVFVNSIVSQHTALNILMNGISTQTIINPRMTYGGCEL